MLPGGLRVQLLIGLTLLLVGSYALAALVVENVITRRLLESRRQHVTAIAAVASDMSDQARRSAVEAGVVDAMVVGTTAFGAPEVVERLQADPSESATILVGNATYLRIHREDVLLAARIDDLSADVDNARSVLVLFGVLVAVVILALGYGFFGLVVIRPIRAIGVATERAAQGDLASAITVVPRNEIGKVASSFNEMLRRIDASRVQLELKVAELQRANQALEDTRDSLVRSEKLASVGQLAAGIAHEIGNPLAALSGYNELLRDGELDPTDVDDILKRSGDQLERIRSVIRNLLDFSRDESGAESRPTDLARCVDETVSLVKAAARVRNVEFVVGDLAGPPALAVPSHVVQVLVNLAMNAVDALGEAGGRVSFTRIASRDRAVIVVEDDGPGISEELHNRVFDPFFTTKDPGQGTGLGLAISARIAESLGGDLQLETAASGGARFLVSLPLAEEA